jgi:hypothetical protein
MEGSVTAKGVKYGCRVIHDRQWYIKVQIVFVKEKRTCGRRKLVRSESCISFSRTFQAVSGKGGGMPFNIRLAAAGVEE